MEINIPENINLEQYTSSLEHCIKGTYKFSGVVYNNICDGTTNFVPHGFWDYTFSFVILAIGIVFILLFLKLLFD